MSEFYNAQGWNWMDLVSNDNGSYNKRYSRINYFDRPPSEHMTQLPAPTYGPFSRRQ